ncbi:iron ABC transporter permease [Ignavibacteria bacterium CHB1]|nr:Hemin transport system permease protein HmuU [Ignavibacteria bacterium]MCC6885264.1 iron ABC transporter permease [Ignavibacteriales bacterium]MCE7953334.1 iron ABC transporter permease [Chlorobi bacterium CHB7]MDL1887249.1 iron ABC transporter permease [Ignavibacteria bacterium CHB1]RIK48448.1 MAG: ABC transporter permease [Ignavibacteriota bacterium]
MKKNFLIISGLLLLLMVLVVVSLLSGSVKISVSSLISLSLDEVQAKIFYDIRLPRVIISILVGAALGSAGIILQSLLKNNLAEPGLLGISAGAGFGAILIFLLPWLISFYFVTPVSFVFAFLTTLFIYLIAKGIDDKYSNFISSNKIILAGIAVNALLASVNGFLLLRAGRSVAQIIFWLNGGLSGRGWTEIYMAGGFILTGVFATVLISKELNILSMGEELSISVGLNIKRVQALCIFISSVLAGGAVAISGIISFVGLVVPNIAKIMVGADHRAAVVCSVLLGAIFLVISDLVARTIIAPSELPVGIVTSFIGAPVFIWIIYRSQKVKTI